jgi:hypothetical protein
LGEGPLCGVGEHGDEKVIQQYVKNQGRNPESYQKIHEGKQLVSRHDCNWGLIILYLPAKEPKGRG